MAIDRMNKLSSIPQGTEVDLSYMYVYVCTNWKTGEKFYYICRNKRDDEYSREKLHGRYIHDYQVLLDGTEIPRTNSIRAGIIDIGDYGYCCRAVAIYEEMDRLGLTGLERDYTYYSNLNGPYNRPLRRRGVRLSIPESKWK